MSTAVVFSYPTHGHIAPALGVAKELAARGERVLFYATERSRKKIEASGAEFRTYPAAYEQFDPSPPTEGLFSDMVRLAALTEELLPKLIQELKSDIPDYVLLDTKSLWGRLTAGVLGVPAITLSVVFGIQPGLVSVADLVNLLYGRADAEKLVSGITKLSAYLEIARRLNGRYQIPLPGIIDYLGNPQPLNVIFTSRKFQLNGDAFDERYQFVGPYIPQNRDADIDFPWDRLTGAPLIYISLGTTFHHAPSFYIACFEAFADRPWQVVVAAGSSPIKGAIPKNFIVCSYVPQLAILRRAALMITHGGMNSINEGLYFGVPMLVVPQRGDQHLTGARVAELGAGLTIAPTAVHPQALQSAAVQILEDAAFGQNAKTLGQSLRNSGGPQRAASAILQYPNRRIHNSA
ncbi:MAG TPA: macrolide family glycosyltransferase [Bryobacteraceae bacterium]